MQFPKYRTIRSIVSDVEDHFSLSSGELRRNKKSRTLVKARKLSVFLCRKYADASWPELGDFMERDHSSLMYLLNENKTRIDDSIKKFEELYETDWVNPRS